MNNTIYKKQKWVEVSHKSQAGVEYKKWKPIYYQVSKEDFYKKV